MLVRRQELAEFSVGLGGACIASGVLVGTGLVDPGAGLGGVGIVLVVRGFLLWK